MVTLRASRNRISDSYTLVSERVFERSVIDDVFCGSELDCFRASTPPIADIGDRDTFLRRSLQPMAIGAHVHVREHGPTQVGLAVSRAQMGVVREVFGNPYVPLYVCHTLYACDGRQHQILAKLVFLRISCEVKIYRHAIGITKRPALLFRSSIVS